VEKEHIVAEIRRTAAANGGKALGKGRFAAETGIREPDWRGRCWARWSDALGEAGFGPNEFQTATPEDPEEPLRRQEAANDENSLRPNGGHLRRGKGAGQEDPEQRRVLAAVEEVDHIDADEHTFPA